MTLTEAQRLFCNLTATLIQHACYMGYQPRWDWGYRPPEVAKMYADRGIGSVHSLHCDRLAIDLVLDDADGHLITDVEKIRPLGEWWESLSGDLYTLRWGGDFTGRVSKDGPHFSMEWEGRA